VVEWRMERDGPCILHWSFLLTSESRRDWDWEPATAGEGGFLGLIWFDLV